MDENNKVETSEKSEVKQPEKLNKPAKKPNPLKEPVYSIDDLAVAAREQFKTTPEVVKAALKTAEVESATLPQAKSIVEKFMKRRVN